jgi:hypothetical protein
MACRAWPREAHMLLAKNVLLHASQTRCGQTSHPRARGVSVGWSASCMPLKHAVARPAIHVPVV